MHCLVLYQNLKSIDAQLRNLETERNIKLDKSKHIEQQLKDDDLKVDDIVIRIKQHLTPESVLIVIAMIVLLINIFLCKSPIFNMATWILLTALFRCSPT